MQRQSVLKRSLSIKTIFALTFVSLSGCLILGYSALSARFFSRGVTQVIIDNMKTGVDIYHRSVAAGSKNPVYYFGDLMITRAWKNMPGVIKHAFPKAVPALGKLYATKESAAFRQSNPNYYVMAVPKGGTVYYVCQWVGFSTPPGIFGWNSKMNIRILIVVSCCLGMAVATVIWLITRRIASPVTALSLWAKSLDKTNIKDTPPDFYYCELNEIAGLIREKIAAEQEGLERDRQFLHFTSHELRTPITVITQNVEVLKKAADMDSNRARQMEKNAVERLGRASDNMGAIMETLLWLGRKSTGDLPRTPVPLESVLAEIVDSLHPLIENKPVILDLKTAPAVITVPEIPLRIVLSNLVRNAFSHTAHGRVAITQLAGTVTIVNHDTGKRPCSTPGFGFGLTLTSKLIRRMNWSCTNEIGPGGYSVTVFF